MHRVPRVSRLSRLPNLPSSYRKDTADLENTQGNSQDCVEVRLNIGRCIGGSYWELKLRDAHTMMHEERNQNTS